MKLTFKDLPRPFWFRVALFILFTCGFCIYTLIDAHNRYNLLGDIFDTLGFLLAAICCFGRFGKRSPANTSTEKNSFTIRPMIPTLLALSCFGDTLGIAIFTCTNIFHIELGYPSWPDIPFLSEYIFLFIAVLCLPAQSLSSTTRSRIIFDSLMIMTAVITFSWYFILGPTVLQGSDTILGEIVGGAYPVMDLLLIFCLLLITARSHDAVPGPILLLLAGGLILSVCGDCLYDYAILHNIHHIGNISSYMVVDLLDIPGSMLISLAAYALRWLNFQCVSGVLSDSSNEGVNSVNHESQTLWRAFLPYALVPAVILLAIVTLQTDNQSPLEIGVYILSGTLLFLVLMRQFLSIRETNLYSQHVERLNKDLSEANARLEELATTDPLTRRPNHRTLVTLLDQEIERTRRYDRSCGILFMDIDHFKALNDGYGHAAGDTVLHDFAARVHSTLRSIDTVGRWGGEEFVAILPEATAQEAYEVAERVRTAVAMQPFEVGGGLSMSCSIGIACYPSHEQTREELLKAADQAMYGAKKLGRNQARLADDPAVLALASDASEGGREETALMGTVKALMELVAARDSGTSQRSQQVLPLITQIAAALGLSQEEIQMVSLAGQMYDIGKIAIPDAILCKPEPLLEEEWAIVRMHPQVSADVVSNIPALRPLAPIIRSHHERWDGMGYPDHLVATNIPLGARIIAVVDAYSAMTMDRPYQPARASSAALAELQRCAGSQFDPQIVTALQEILANSQDQPLLAQVVA